MAPRNKGTLKPAFRQPNQFSEVLVVSKGKQICDAVAVALSTASPETTSLLLGIGPLVLSAAVLQK